MIHISLPAEIIFHFFSFPVTNSLLVTWILMVFLFIVTFFATRNLQAVPSGLHNITEMVLDGLSNLFEGMVGQKARKFFPLVATFFIFIILGNWLGLIPGFGSIGFWEVKDQEMTLVPFFRRITSDLNTTIALALFSVGAIQYFGLKEIKLSYLKKFVNLRGPIDFFVGSLEIISEIAKIISFSFRLFGNMFAGEVLIVVISFLIPVIAPVPFMFLEVFVGFIQAFIFATLTLVFLSVAVSHSQH
ncbi:MAG: F0F1 ATP synthase subunit A [bacterium]|nr:F0F1 ATP synthase subunit A [bacterium]